MISGIIFYPCLFLSLLQIGRNLALQCQDDKTMDCAKLDKMFDICKDIHDAKLVCPNFCKLCLLVDGNWADWSLWSTCDVTCGDGKQTRVRTCTNPTPAYQGLECEGEKIETKPCVRSLCPVHGGWSSWSNWNACPVTCGLGIQKRYRNCSNPYPLRFGDHCFGDSVGFRNCFSKLCDVDGRWSTWSNWNACPVTCGIGIQKRYRNCPNPYPMRFNHHCYGDPVDFRNCFKKTCDDGQWGNWESWGICSPSCDSGLRQRSRSCTNHVGTMCKGKSLDVRMCNNQDCLTACTTKPAYYASFKNVAFGKKVQLSSTHNSYYGKYMVDGNYNNIVHTNTQQNPFAMIDLGKIYSIVLIVIVNRQDCCASRLRNVVIKVGVVPNILSTVARHPAPIAAKPNCALRLKSSFRGRYVKILLETTETLNIAEVEVYSNT